MKKVKSFLVRNWKKITLAVIVLGFFSFLVFRSKGDEVETTKVTRGDVVDELILSGEINATNYAKLSFETAGKIIYVGVEEGEEVKKGKLISKLDTTILNSSYQIALSNLRAAEAAVANVHDQVKDHSGDETYAQKDLRTQAEVAKDKAYEAVISTKRSLDGASLFTPFSGIVTYLSHPFTGVYTTPSTVEAEIIDPTTIYFKVSADQNEVTKLKEGMDVEIILDSYEDRSFKGKLENISYVPQPGTVGSVYGVKVDFVDQDFDISLFRIAMTGEARFKISEKEDVLTVPSNFVKEDKDGNYLKLDSEGKQKIYVTIGVESEDASEIVGEIDENLLIYD